MRTRVRQQVLMGALLGFGAALCVGALLARRAPPPAPPPVVAPAPHPAAAAPARRPVLERATPQEDALPVRADGVEGPRPLPLRAVGPVRR